MRDRLASVAGQRDRWVDMYCTYYTDCLYDTETEETLIKWDNLSDKLVDKNQFGYLEFKIKID